MPTIHDVAKRAGVAPITVSRVVNNSGYVADELRTRVQAAVVELGYVPNRLARSLRSRRTNTLALVLSDITNPFFTTVARGVEDAASAAGYMVIVCNSDERADKEQTYLRLLLQQQVDGILLVPARGAAESVGFARGQRTPVVVLDRRADGVDADVVRCDSEGGAYQLARLLTHLGHRRIAVLAGPSGVATSDDRVAGFQRALSEHPEACGTIFHGELTQDSGAALVRTAMSADPRPTAVLASNNFITIGALHGLRELGLNVPADVALVGFDDLPEALLTFPFLTVVAQPAYEMGRRAVERLLCRLRGEADAGFQEIVLPTWLEVRASSGPPRAAEETR